MCSTCCIPNCSPTSVCCFCGGCLCSDTTCQWCLTGSCCACGANVPSTGLCGTVIGSPCNNPCVENLNPSCYIKDAPGGNIAGQTDNPVSPHVNSCNNFNGKSGSGSAGSAMGGGASQKQNGSCTGALSKALQGLGTTLSSLLARKRNPGSISTCILPNTGSQPSITSSGFLLVIVFFGGLLLFMAFSKGGLTE